MIHGWIPVLDRKIWLLLCGYTISLFGTGMTGPFLIVYLHQVHGIVLPMAGAVIAASSVAGVVAIPMAGWAGDRFGTRWSLMNTLLICAAGQTGMAFIHGPEWAFAASFLTGAGETGSWNALSSLLAESVKSDRRNDVFGVAYGLQNFGGGLGAAVGGVLLNVHSGLSFTIVFLFDAFSFLLFALFAGSRVAGGGRRKRIVQNRSSPQNGGYRAVFKDGSLMATILLYALFAVIMVGLGSTAFPQWATGPANSSTRVVGLAFLVNSCVVVGGQLFVLRMAEGRRRTRTVALTALTFAGGCAVIYFSGVVRNGVLTAAGFIFAWALVGFGETLLFSSLPALVNNLASDSLRGRYNSMFNLSWQIGSIVGPPLAGWMLGHHWDSGLFFGFTVISGMLAVFALGLERVLPHAINEG
ncbi:MAG TPA: MFS transporter [Bacillales bacterium]|nr:MFS transporter [Bacillales bacterium]